MRIERFSQPNAGAFNILITKPENKRSVEYIYTDVYSIRKQEGKDWYNFGKMFDKVQKKSDHLICTTGSLFFMFTTRMTFIVSRSSLMLMITVIKLLSPIKGLMIMIMSATSLIMMMRTSASSLTIMMIMYPKCHLNDWFKSCLLPAHVADEPVAKQQCKTLVKIIVIMKMMMITIDIIIMVLRDTDTLERFSPLVSRRKRKFLYLSHHCLWCPKFEKYSDIHHGRHCHLIITRKFQGSETQGLCHFYRYQAN